MIKKMKEEGKRGGGVHAYAMQQTLPSVAILLSSTSPAASSPCGSPKGHLDTPNFVKNHMTRFVRA
jgi:hypothetical protein